MKTDQRSLRAGVLAAALVAGGLLLADGPAVAQDGCISAACHAKLLQSKTVHSVAEGCETCHESVATPHPKAGEKTFKLTQEMPDICYMCHESFADKSVVHFPVTGGMCTSCHNPHSADEPKLLSQVVVELCRPCHGDVLEKVEQAPVMHAAVQGEGSCVMCHSPHAGENAKLMLSPEKEVCLGCHGDVVAQNMKVLHGPIAEGRCAACHEPHGGQNAKLLTKPFPAGIYVPYTGAEFPLCFECHKRDMLQQAETSSATNFRDGKRNLHFVHVNNEKKGRSCRVCHEIHGSAGPRLIAVSVPFGKWNLPLKFEKTETGGGCSPGCHKPLLYDREDPGKKPPPPKRKGKTSRFQ